VNQNKPVSLGRGTTYNNMAGLDNTLRLPKFKGIGLEDPEKHMFVCETMWTTNNVHNDSKYHAVGNKV
jgi:hypothetical protein